MEIRRNIPGSLGRVELIVRDLINGIGIVGDIRFDEELITIQLIKGGRTISLVNSVFVNYVMEVNNASLGIYKRTVDSSAGMISFSRFGNIQLGSADYFRIIFENMDVASTYSFYGIIEDGIAKEVLTYKHFEIPCVVESEVIDISLAKRIFLRFDFFDSLVLFFGKEQIEVFVDELVISNYKKRGIVNSYVDVLHATDQFWCGYDNFLAIDLKPFMFGRNFNLPDGIKIRHNDGLLTPLVIEYSESI